MTTNLRPGPRAALAFGIVLFAAGTGAAVETRPFECPPVHAQPRTALEIARQCQLLPEADRPRECASQPDPSPGAPAQALTHVEIVDFDGLNYFTAKPRVIYCGYQFVERGFETSAHCRFDAAWKYEHIARKAIRTGVVANVYFCKVDHEIGQVCKIVCTHRTP